MRFSRPQQTKHNHIKSTPQKNDKNQSCCNKESSIPVILEARKNQRIQQNLARAIQQGQNLAEREKILPKLSLRISSTLRCYSDWIRIQAWMEIAFATNWNWVSHQSSVSFSISSLLDDEIHMVRYYYIIIFFLFFTYAQACSLFPTSPIPPISASYFVFLLYYCTT